MDVNAEQFRVRSVNRNREIRQQQILGGIDTTTAILILGGLYIFSRLYEARQQGKQSGPTIIRA